MPLLPSATPPELTYNIASGHLSGAIDGQHISAYAGSGGRAGTKTKDGLNWWLANNPFATQVKLPANKSHPGGPLPYGVYSLGLHESRENWLRLVPLDPGSMHGRSGMAIHGRGPRGSDGCIVPTDFAVVLRLCKLVKQRQEAGGAPVRLEVVAIGQDLDRQLRTA
ncbi:MAG TPA: hypothetical protein VFW67_12900 [Burkholderiaceae bacterium]|nr:hypothetical protein [Burkholderiaceae bacterium]